MPSMFLQLSLTMTSVGIISSTTKGRVSTYSASWWRHQMGTFSALLAICANSPHKGQWRGALMFSLICVWINDWVIDREAGDLRRYRAHYDVIVMFPFLAIVVRKPTRRLPINCRVDDPLTSSIEHSLSNGCNAISIYICRNHGSTVEPA